MESPRLAVIGGTGVYAIESLSDVEEISVDTPYGRPSDTIILGTLQGLRLAFLARHGRRHTYLPSEVPYRANIWALKSLGVKQIVAVSACGSLKDAYAPGHIVIPDQVFDRTRGRAGTFFGDGIVAHIAFAEPFCRRLRVALREALIQADARVHFGGVYVIIEGPRFSSKGESLIYRGWGADIIGMTILPEAALAREAEICYAVMAHVTDYDCWHEVAEPVSVELVIRTLQANAGLVKQAVVSLCRDVCDAGEAACACHDALANAILTPLDQVPPAILERLRPIMERSPIAATSGDHRPATSCSGAGE